MILSPSRAVVSVFETIERTTHQRRHETRAACMRPWGYAKDWGPAGVAWGLAIQIMGFANDWGIAFSIDIIPARVAEGYAVILALRVWMMSIDKPENDSLQ